MKKFLSWVWGRGSLPLRLWVRHWLQLTEPSINARAVREACGGYEPRPGVVVPALNSLLHLLRYVVVTHVRLGAVLQPTTSHTGTQCPPGAPSCRSLQGALISLISPHLTSSRALNVP